MTTTVNYGISGGGSGGAQWSDATGMAQITPSGGVRAAVARKLLSAYEAQSHEDAIYGPRLLARTGYPVSADVPTITASPTARAGRHGGPLGRSGSGMINHKGNS